MRTLKTLLILLPLLLSSSCSNPKKNISSELKHEIDTYLARTMELHDIPGLALAVIEDHKVVYKNYFGKSSIENNNPVNEHTLFRVFSTTKLITATGVFQLIEEGKLNLEDTVSKHLDHLPVQWQEIKIKNLLSHSSGLPDIIKYESTISDKELMEKLSKDKMDFTTGYQFRYNQTNYWLLAQIIEKVTGMTFDEFILKNQFDIATDGVLFSSDSQEIIPNRAMRYFYDHKTKEFEKDTNNSGKRGYSGNGLNITLESFIEWNKKLDTDRLLDKKTKSKMWAPFNFENQQDHFLHGWGHYSVNNLDSYGFTGGNLAGFRKFVNDSTTIILLSNGYQIPAYDIIINDIARMIIPDLKTKKLTKEEDVMALTLDNQFDKATQSFKKLRTENPNSSFDNLKWNINGLGNSYVGINNKKALEVFKFNASANPNWWVSSASLAEAYELQKDTLNAISNYKKAIAHNTNNEWDYNKLMTNKIKELKK
ncbi:MAG: serine hydrolase [Flavobacteriaceae bacterium]|nr:serine hydrolase [Flavobacteriaceae bacterium]